MFRVVEVPLWLLVLILLFAAVTFASHFLFPSVRWFFRRRAERIVAKLNERLERPIQPFKLARRADTILHLIYDPEVLRAVTQHAADTGVREDVAFEQARRYAREIVPGFSATAYFGFATRATRWLATRLYDVRLGRDGSEERRSIHGDATVVYVINHRSNMDYVLITYLVAEHAALSYAVGEWARIWPLQPLIRALGGYFIRRRSRNALYRKVLARYVQKAVDAGVTQAVFPEGGLSQTGRLGTPKVGILSYIIDGSRQGERNVVFVPVGLNYDRVIEDRILVEAHARGETRFRGTIVSATAFSLRYVWRRIFRRAHRFGLAGVSFGEPISLSDRPDAGPEALAKELMRRAARVVPLFPVPLVSYLLAEADGPVAKEALVKDLGNLVECLGARGAVMPTAADGADAMLDTALWHLGIRRFISDQDGPISVLPEKRALIEFYAGSVRDVKDALAESTSSPRPDGAVGAT